MAKTSFEELEVYQLSERLADAIWLIVQAWKPFERDTVGKQLVRAADSVGANLAEGVGRPTFADTARFIGYARASLYVTKHWLRRAHRRGLVTTEATSTIKPLIEELLPRLNAYLRSTRKRARTQGHSNEQ